MELIGFLSLCCLIWAVRQLFVRDEPRPYLSVERRARRMPIYVRRVK